jgi:voltage-gated potassium channel
MDNYYKNHSVAKIYISIVLLISLLLTGTIGYKLIEGYRLLDALYMTVITVTTVGYGEVVPLSENGRIFTIILIIISFGTFAYAITSISNYVISGELNNYFKNRKVHAEIQKLKKHIIICGFGRNGRQAALQLKQHNKPFVIIERNHHHIERILQHNYLYLEGDATQEQLLIEANIKEASALITTLPNDADNLFIVLTARTFNPGLTIVSRASDENSDKKLKIAGANNVIMPDKIGGDHMASLVLKPDIIEFIDVITGQGSVNIKLEEIFCKNLPEHLINKSIKELEIRNISGANIIGFKTADGNYIINPGPETKMIPEAKIFVLGTTDQIIKIKNFLNIK